ncbi:hypothetical protein [Geobacter sp. SVR]|uniref:hypothetical protein n=1 Tax=Geobacter sp. SVR TaxID=2495594 RepID=UPI00143EFFF1|nr:hypothetical protein [Geobacter sp. SVR]BCS54774.1 hypothetical protein GSVR_30820 [Geobacter sp. SVR]GCF86418.1 hypothetical protein GSbR_30180 [Geobacter sp. SVR]
MSAETRRKLIVTLAAAILTTEPVVDPPAATDPPVTDPPVTDPPADDLTALFTPEDIQAKKNLIAANKAEEERLAALTDEQRAEEDRIKAEETAKDQAPEQYADFKVPEGIVLDPAMMEKFAPLAKSLNLSQEKAQGLIDLATEMQQRTMDGIFEAHETRKATWLQEAQNDPEIGADIKLGHEGSAAYRAFNTIAASHPDMKAMVDETGIGNHPAFLRVFFHLSKHLREDTFEIPSGGGEGAKGSIANSLWPGMK